jgi:nucleotide-binding universal stress UspA family protein
LATAEGVIESELKEFQERDSNLRLESAIRFENLCVDAGIEFSLHHDRNIAIVQLLHESIYADILLIDKAETLTRFIEKVPTRFVRDLLSNAQCPVMIVPDEFKEIEQVIFLYDGQPSSVYAVKMFTCLFGNVKFKAEVLSIKKENQNLHLPDNRLMKEFMQRHCPEAEYFILKGNPEDEIVKFINRSKKNSLIVMGSYQRGTISMWFHESMADKLMKETDCPLFIAHYK